jgi:hypothetical protein
MTPPTFAIGDIHGHDYALVKHLRGAGLIDDMHHWSGGSATLICTGDYVDRGPDGIAVIERMMRWEREAAASGGRVITLLGNHDLVLAAAYRFGHGRFREMWLHNGGERSDLHQMHDHHLQWLLSRPAMHLTDDLLLVHADAELYYDYGRTIAEVNDRIAAVARGDDKDALQDLLEAFGEHRTFYEDSARAGRFQATYGGSRILHGHSPIQKMNKGAAALRPLIYAGGRCVNLDGGMYMGGAGFVWQVE